MLSDLQRRKLELRFMLLDTDGNGYLSQEDYELVTLRLCAAFGHLPGSIGYTRVLRAYLALWGRLRDTMNPDDTGRIALDQFVECCERFVVDDPDGYELHLKALVDLVFEIADADGDGVIDLAEFTAWMHAYGVGARDTVDTFDRLDADGDGVLSHADMNTAGEQFYRSSDPTVAGNWLFGPL